MKSLQALIDLLTLEQIDTCLFRGQNYKTPWGRVYGGQVLGQALNAAYRTVPEDRIAHSMHGYFVLTGDIHKPIIYRVETIRDGGSFTTRRVTASQNGKPIFVMTASFQLSQPGLDHQPEKPEVLDPGKVKTDMEQADSIKEFSPALYEKVKAREQNAIVFKPIDMFSFDGTIPGNPQRKVWMKTTSPLEMSLPMQHQLLAFSSDYDLLVTALYPHMGAVDLNKLFLASLDHAMWFHRSVDLNDWLLYVINSPNASNSRGLGYGSIFNQAGELVATVMQEGLMRKME